MVTELKAHEVLSQTYNYQLSISSRVLLRDKRRCKFLLTVVDTVVKRSFVYVQTRAQPRIVATGVEHEVEA